MASVMAIVSKALFEKMVPKGVSLGTVVEVDRYVSANKAFDSLGSGNSIFMVTVRPPDEKLWLVAVLDNPTRKGSDWHAANAAPLTDVTATIKKLKFESGTGLAAKKGALGMSLQTPRVLTDADVKLFRDLVAKAHPSGKKITANTAYRAAVDAVIASPKKKKGKASKLGGLRLANGRKPSKGTQADLAKHEVKQLETILGKGKVGTLFDGKLAEDLAEISIVDVVDTATGTPKYQLVLFGYGDGTMFAHGTTKEVVGVCQHGLDGDITPALTRDLALAWIEGAKREKLWPGHIDFDDDELGSDDDDDDE